MFLECSILFMHLKKAFIEFVTILFLFYVLVSFFFGHQVCGILGHGPGIEPNPPALEGEVLTTGPLGKLLFMCF